MADYALYKYIFNKSDDNNIFTSLTQQKAIEQAQQELEKAVKGELFFVKKQKNKEGEYERLNYKLLRSHGGISVLMICNVKRRKYQEGKEDHTLEHHPGCYVVIDNRPGIAQIAIERSSAFDRNADSVSDLLSRSLNRVFNDMGLSIDIQPRVSSNDFWETVDTIMYKRKDAVQSIAFHFATEQTIGPVDASEEELMRMSFLTSMIAAFDAGESSFNMRARKDKSLRLDRTHRDVAMVIDLCCRNGYEIAVNFKNSGLYRSGEQVRITREMDEGILLAFIHRDLDLFSRNGLLGEWLDDALQSSRNEISLT